MDNLPKTARERASFVGAFRMAMGKWMSDTKVTVAALEISGTEARRVLDILEWSFTNTIKEICRKKLGTKKAGRKPPATLDAAMRLLNSHRKNCEQTLKRVMADKNSTAEMRVTAVQLYRQAKSELFRATKRRLEVRDLQLFTQIEEGQGTKLFWSMAKKLSSRLQTQASPPSVAKNEMGMVTSDHTEVLRVWRKFSAGVASTTPEEEGIYDDEYKEEIEARLRELRMRKVTTRT